MADRFSEPALVEAQRNELVSQQSQAPSFTSVRGCRASQDDQVCFGSSVDLGRAAGPILDHTQTGVESFAYEASADAGPSGCATSKGISDFFIAPG